MATCDPWKISHPGTHWLDYVDNSIILMVQEIVTSWHIGWRKKPHCFSTILTSYVWKVSEFPGCKIRWKNLLSRVSRCVFLGPIGEYDFVKIVKATVWQIRRFQTESPNITGRVRLKKWFVILLLPVVFRWWRLPQKSNFHSDYPIHPTRFQTSKLRTWVVETLNARTTATFPFAWSERAWGMFLPWSWQGENSRVGSLCWGLYTHYKAWWPSPIYGV